MDAYAMAATVDFGLEAKQGLLDLRSENARLRLVTRLFRAALKRLDFVDRAQARAKSNGKVPLRLSRLRAAPAGRHLGVDDDHRRAEHQAVDGERRQRARLQVAGQEANGEDGGDRGDDRSDHSGAADAAVARAAR